MFPDLRIEEQGRIVELALGRTALVTMAVVLALAPLTVHGQAVESVGGGHPLSCCPPASSRAMRGRDLWIALALGETGHVDSVRVSPALRGARGHAISLVVLVTVRCLMDNLLPPLTIPGQRREDGEPDVSGRSVWRQLLSPRLLLSLERLL